MKKFSELSTISGNTDRGLNRTTTLDTHQPVSLLSPMPIQLVFYRFLDALKVVEMVT
jgi:hypothetical protein